MHGRCQPEEGLVPLPPARRGPGLCRARQRPRGGRVRRLEAHGGGPEPRRRRASRQSGSRPRRVVRPRKVLPSRRPVCGIHLPQAPAAAGLLPRRHDGVEASVGHLAGGQGVLQGGGIREEARHRCRDLEVPRPRARGTHGRRPRCRRGLRLARKLRGQPSRRQEARGGLQRSARGRRRGALEGLRERRR